ncbi:hypothetical protein DSL72_001858 [Monilinia vaccinii-corymbosi]|uniref:NADPH-dependent diflavin oxidoreductase 1 n=1 Tax=Monilinia vaccinii-corymbosi TaxID=61207 RepID=A0A8A3PB11_9HELO|nr:hypothetical protein DSL72_001858 [Monilinia vaccinii-corymbosi]
MSEVLGHQQHDRTDRTDRRALILYGSETGNSYDVAEELGRVMERLHFMTRVIEMDLVDIRELSKYTLVLFTISTTGQGEFPKNSRKFWNSLLRKRLPPDCLSHVNFTTFGLGDSSYAKFNFAARKLHKRLEQLGGNEIYPRGEGDEQHEEGVDGTFLSWYIDLRKKLLELYPLPDGLEQIPDGVLLPPKYWLELRNESSTLTDKSNSPLENNGKIHHTKLESLNSKLAFPDDDNFQQRRQQQQKSISGNATMVDTSGLGYDEPAPSNRLTDFSHDGPETIDRVFPKAEPLLDLPGGFDVMVTANKRVTPLAHWQDVREITFSTRAEIAKKFVAGDTISIYPKNFPKDAQTLIDLMGWNDVADLHLHFHARTPDWFAAKRLVSLQSGLYPIDGDQTLRELLIHNLDFQAIPKRHFFEIMAKHTDDPIHKARLLEFRDPLYTDEFYDYTSRPRRSILETLQDFPSVKLPWKHATTMFPVIRGREFSICSGGSLHRPEKKDAKFAQFQILVAIVKYRTVLHKIRNGLCSRYLASISCGSEITVRHNINQSFSEKPSVQRESPLIMVAAGTGVAPIRSLLYDRAMQRMAVPKEYTLLFGKAYLIYGGRNRNADYFYEDEWRTKGALGVTVHPVFSRDGPQKVYVQDEIKRQGEELCTLLMNHNALIYVCGSSGGMPKGVRLAFLHILQVHGGMSEAEAEAFVARMERLKRYIQETW